MQPSIHLNQKDIARLRKAIERLNVIGDQLIHERNGSAAEEKKVVKRRRKKRAAAPDESSPE